MSKSRFEIIEEDDSYVKLKLKKAFISNKLGFIIQVLFWLLWIATPFFAFNNEDYYSPEIKLFFIGLVSFFSLIPIWFMIKNFRKSRIHCIIEITDSHLFYEKYYNKKKLESDRIYLPQLYLRSQGLENIELDNRKGGSKILIENIHRQDQDELLKTIEKIKLKN